MQLPIIRLVGRKFYKVIYKGDKWAFEKGIDYKELHPTFIAHLSKLVDDHGNFLFKKDNGHKIVILNRENSYEAVNKDWTVRAKMRRKTRDFKEKLSLTRKNKRTNKESQLNSGGTL